MRSLNHCNLLFAKISSCIVAGIIFLSTLDQPYCSSLFSVLASLPWTDCCLQISVHLHPLWLWRLHSWPCPSYHLEHLWEQFLSLGSSRNLSLREFREFGQCWLKSHPPICRHALHLLFFIAPRSRILQWFNFLAAWRLMKAYSLSQYNQCIDVYSFHLQYFAVMYSARSCLSIVLSFSALCSLLTSLSLASWMACIHLRNLRLFLCTNAWDTL